ncbi:FkbM family methyltransferase [Alkalicella caledoniensis]|uniref:FkbM family methyltransferase n=1 Tax=Alkalicella caledoniensis TaxID=2731377 RepID=A0A7G9W700_ALKCA|nr:FkbM family methyltransferase [Alkalicella caledoniensis]QNO14462.1 FkbM family methyltransferase [Alkalicella caledoniensis]
MYINDDYKYKIISKIEKLIHQGFFDEAWFTLKQYKEKIGRDSAIASIESTLWLLQNQLDEAEEVLNKAVEEFPFDFDLLFNLASLYQIKGNLDQAVNYYLQCKDLFATDEQKLDLISLNEKIRELSPNCDFTTKPKLVFFIKKGMNYFFNNIMENFKDRFTVKKITVSNYSQIQEGMMWADISWFDWCDDLLVKASKLELSREKVIIARLHSYEAFTPYISAIDWTSIDKVVFVANHIRNYVLSSKSNLSAEKTVVIPNGIKLEDYPFEERSKGFNIAYVGRLNFKKGPMLLLHAFKAIVDKDKRFMLHIAGKFEEPRYILYFRQMIEEMDLKNNIIFSGWHEDINKWLEDKNYIISSSLLESQQLSIMEAMAKGIKPLIHNFVGAKEIYPSQFIWTTISDLLNLVFDDEYKSSDYRKFIEENYSLDKEISSLERNVTDIMYKGEKTKVSNQYTFGYKGIDIKMEFPNSIDHISQVIRGQGAFYEKQMLEDIESRIKPGSVIVDIGANIGNHTVFFGKFCNPNKVHAFEPQPDVYQILTNNIEHNNLQQIVNCYNFGIGESQSRANLIKNKENLGMAKLIDNSEGNVQVFALDDVIIDEKVDLMKIDVEGMEMQVLKGSKRIIELFRPIIYIEAQNQKEFNNISEFLSEFGYEPKQRFNHTPTYLFVCE